MAYENGLVPALMKEWPARLIAAASTGPGGRVLDVACGTGVLARAVAAAVGPSGTVVGLDLDRGMLRVALARRPEVRWVQGSATHLPLATASFDAVVSQFGLMFFADKPRSLREMWRVLRPGGRVVVAVWASLEATPGTPQRPSSSSASRAARRARRCAFRSGSAIGGLEQPLRGRRRSAGVCHARGRPRLFPKHPSDGGGRPRWLAAADGRATRARDDRGHPGRSGSGARAVPPARRIGCVRLSGQHRRQPACARLTTAGRAPLRRRCRKPTSEMAHLRVVQVEPVLSSSRACRKPDAGEVRHIP